MGLVSLVGLVGLVVGPGGFSGSCQSSVVVNDTLVF